VKVELKKVTWPSRKQTLGSTAVVIVLVMIISLFLGLVDLTLSSLIQFVLR
jgi:preprotein translocase subunit SecE